MGTITDNGSITEEGSGDITNEGTIEITGTSTDDLAELLDTDVSVIGGIDSVARWSDGKEVFSTNPAPSTNWDTRLGTIAAPNAQQRVVKQIVSGGEATNIVSVKLTATTDYKKHYNSAGVLGAGPELKSIREQTSRGASRTQRSRNLR